jgi:type I restriction enzyme M protein
MWNLSPISSVCFGGKRWRIWRVVRPYTKESFPDGVDLDVLGLCRVATLAEVEVQGWSLNPGSYVGVAERLEAEDFDFSEALETLNEELEVLNREGSELEARIAENVAQLLNC